MSKIKKFARNLFSAIRMKMLAMMLFCGTAVTFAQNAAGDYTGDGIAQLHYIRNILRNLLRNGGLLQK